MSKGVQHVQHSYTLRQTIKTANVLPYATQHLLEHTKRIFSHQLLIFEEHYVTFFDEVEITVTYMNGTAQGKFELIQKVRLIVNRFSKYRTFWHQGQLFQYKSCLREIVLKFLHDMNLGNTNISVSCRNIQLFRLISDYSLFNRDYLLIVLHQTIVLEHLVHQKLHSLDICSDCLQITPFLSQPAEGTDYLPSVSKVVFMPADTQVCFNTSILDDKVHERNEDFGIMLSSPDSRIMIDRPLVTVTILDEDSEYNSNVQIRRQLF